MLGSELCENKFDGLLSLVYIVLNVYNIFVKLTTVYHEILASVNI